MARLSVKAIGNTLVAIVAAVVILFLMFYAASAGQRDLAERVDARVETIEVQLARHRYVTDCLFYTGPFVAPELEPETPPGARDVAALRLCLSESLVIGPDDVDDIGVILEENLNSRGVE